MNKQSKAREYNMDLERVILIFMVIVLHYNNRAMGGALTYGYVGGVVEALVRFSESLCICAVNAFLLLSGYFAAGGYSAGSNFKKAVWLLASCSFYRVVGYTIYALRITGDFSFRTFVAYQIPSNWYVCLFVAVLLLSPYINRLMGLLGEKSRREFIVVLSVLFCVIPSVVTFGSEILEADLSGLATISINGDIDGFTIVSFVYCYCLGYFLRMEKEKLHRVSKWNYLAVFFFSVCTATAISYYTEKVWSYSNVFTVIEAVSLSLFFSKIVINSPRIGRILSEIGGCGLGIFIWHTMPLMIFGYWVHLNIDQIGNGGVAYYLGNFWTATLSMYVLSLILVLICRKITGFTKGRLKKKESLNTQE